MSTKDDSDTQNSAENSIKDEIKSDAHHFYEGVKDGISGKNDQEKMQNIGRKSVQLVKGYLIIKIAIIILVIVAIIAIFVTAFGGFDRVYRLFDRTQDTILESVDKMQDNVEKFEDEVENKIDTGAFNSNIEIYTGRQFGALIPMLLNSITENIKKNPNHPIVVIYNDTATADVEEITALKKKFDESAEYDVDLGYDTNGFINKVTIEDY